jgi:hypothetical protein
MLGNKTMPANLPPACFSDEECHKPAETSGRLTCGR